METAEAKKKYGGKKSPTITVSEEDRRGQKSDQFWFERCLDALNLKTFKSQGEGYTDNRKLLQRSPVKGIKEWNINYLLHKRFGHCRDGYGRKSYRMRPREQWRHGVNKFRSTISVKTVENRKARNIVAEL